MNIQLKSIETILFLYNRKELYPTNIPEPTLSDFYYSIRRSKEERLPFSPSFRGLYVHYWW